MRLDEMSGVSLAELDHIHCRIVVCGRRVSSRPRFRRGRTRVGETIMKATLARFFREDSGEDLIEYGLLAAFVAAVAVGMVVTNQGIRDGIINAFQKAIEALDRAG